MSGSHCHPVASQRYVWSGLGLGTLPLKGLQTNQGGGQTEQALSSLVLSFTRRVEILYSQCFNTFLSLWQDTFSRADPNCAEVGGMNPNLCLLPPILLHFKCKYEWRNSPDQYLHSQLYPSATRASHVFTQCIGSGTPNTALPSILSFRRTTSLLLQLASFSPLL